jgi:hypothetical protein
VKTVTLTWQPVSGADSYYLRVDYLANNVNGAWYVSNSLDYNIDAYTQTSFTGSIAAGQDYQWWVHAANSTSGLSLSASATFKCATSVTSPDTTPPVVAITAPVSGAKVSGIVNISASASDNVGVVGVQFRVDGVNFGSELSAQPYTVVWDTRKLKGSYKLSAVARDAAGNQSVASVSVTIGNGKAAVGAALTSSKVDQAGEISVGYTRLDEGTSEAIGIIRIRDGERIVSENFIAPTANMTTGRVFVTVDGAVNSGVAIANDAGADAEVSFFFTDGQGNDFGQGSFTLEAKHSIAAFVSQFPFNMQQSIQGTLTFTSSIPVAVTGLRTLTNDQGDLLLTVMPVVALTTRESSSDVIPQVTFGNGWSTQLLLMNPTDAPLEGTVDFFNAASAQVALPMKITLNGATDSQFRYTIAPRSVALIGAPSPGGEVRSGYALVRASGQGPLPHSVSVLSFSVGDIKTSEAIVSATSPGTAFRTYVEMTDTLRAAVTVANSSASPADTAFELVMLDGSVNRANVTIPAGGQMGLFLNELFTELPERFSGMLRIVSGQPVSVASLHIRDNPGGLIISSSPIEDATAPAAYPANRVFPFTINGGPYSTEVKTQN